MYSDNQDLYSNSLNTIPSAFELSLPDDSFHFSEAQQKSNIFQKTCKQSRHFLQLSGCRASSLLSLEEGQPTMENPVAPQHPHLNQQLVGTEAKDVKETMRSKGVANNQSAVDSTLQYQESQQSIIDAIIEHPNSPSRLLTHAQEMGILRDRIRDLEDQTSKLAAMVEEEQSDPANSSGTHKPMQLTGNASTGAMMPNTSAYSQSNKQLEEDITKVNREIQRALEQLGPMPPDYESLQAYTQQLQEQIAMYKQQIDKLNEISVDKYAKMYEEIHKERQNYLKQQNQYEESIRALQEKLNNVQEENDRLHGQMREQQQEHSSPIIRTQTYYENELDHLHKELDLYHRKFVEKESRLKSLEAAAESSHNKNQDSQLLQVIKQLKIKLSNANKQQATQQSQYKEMCEQLQALHSQNRHLQQQLALNGLQIKSLEEQYEKSKEQSNRMSTEKQSIRNQYEQLSIKYEDAIKSHEQISGKMQQLEMRSVQLTKDNKVLERMILEQKVKKTLNQQVESSQLSSHRSQMEHYENCPLRSSRLAGTIKRMRKDTSANNDPRSDGSTGGETNNDPRPGDQAGKGDEQHCCYCSLGVGNTQWFETNNKLKIEQLNQIVWQLTHQVNGHHSQNEQLRDKHQREIWELKQQLISIVEKQAIKSQKLFREHNYYPELQTLQEQMRELKQEIFRAAADRSSTSNTNQQNQTAGTSHQIVQPTRSVQTQTNEHVPPHPSQIIHLTKLRMHPQYKSLQNQIMQLNRTSLSKQKDSKRRIKELEDRLEEYRIENEYHRRAIDQMHEQGQESNSDSLQIRHYIDRIYDMLLSTGNRENVRTGKLLKIEEIFQYLSRRALNQSANQNQIQINSGQSRCMEIDHKCQWTIPEQTELLQSGENEKTHNIAQITQNNNKMYQKDNGLVEGVTQQKIQLLRETTQQLKSLNKECQKYF